MSCFAASSLPADAGFKEVECIASPVIFLLLISFGVVGIIVCTLMFALRRENWHTALFLSAVFISVLLTLMSAVGRPSNQRILNLWAWVGLLPAAAGVLLYFKKPRRRPLASLLVAATIVLGMASLFF